MCWLKLVSAVRYESEVGLHMQNHVSLPQSSVIEPGKQGCIFVLSIKIKALAGFFWILY
jgi:hypothetical protein